MITAEDLRALLRYDPDTGEFTLVTSGRSVGHVSDGYTRLYVNGHYLSAHRVAWAHFHGVWPLGQIDHINGVKTDNRIANLRMVSIAENGQNRRAAQRNNSSGLLGVSKHKGRWRARITAAGQRHELGTFSTPTDAHMAYVAAKRHLHPFGTI